MANIGKPLSKYIRTNSVSYKKLLAWEIENFEDWWSSSRIAVLGREEGSSTSMDEENRIKARTNWRESSHSPTMNLVIEGIYHEFEVAVLKYDSYDRHDDDHNLIMGISVYYKGPSESIIIKPSFCIKGTDDYAEDLFTAQELSKNSYSDCRTFNNHSLMNNKKLILTEGWLTIQCFIEIVTLHVFSENHLPHETKIHSRKPWSRNLPEFLDFSGKASELDAFSDFDIVCLEKNENGEEREKRFRCHKIVLFLGTNYYKKMFLGNFAESEGMAKVTDISSKTMGTFLKFLYCGEVKKIDIDIDLLLAADKYDVVDLQSICELELANRITIETAPRLAVVCFACGSDNFKAHVYAFVRKHWKKIITCNQSKLITKNSQLLCEILDRS